MRIGILGTGNLALTLGQAWGGAGHQVILAGRDRGKAAATALAIGFHARDVDADRLAAESEAIVVAISWEGLDEALALAGAPDGAFRGKTILDATNTVDFETGKLKLTTGSAAEHLAVAAPGARVVKALHLFAGQSWLTLTSGATQTVAICGDDDEALQDAAALIEALGGTAAVIGGLDKARQLEDVAGFVMALAAAGSNPATAVPSIQSQA